MNTIPLVGISVWLVVKIFVLIAFLFYSIFALVVVRQVQLMTKTINVGYEIPLKMLSYAHLLMVVFILLAALVVL